VNSRSVVFTTNKANVKRGHWDWTMGDSLYYYRKTRI